MKKNIKSRNPSIHLYNPQEEGVGLYDVHYMNAYKKQKENRSKQEINNKAWRAA